MPAVFLVLCEYNGKVRHLLIIHGARFLVTLLPGNFELLRRKCLFMNLIIRIMILGRHHSKCFICIIPFNPHKGR